MLERAFDCELAHHIRHLASLSLVFPFCQMTWASTSAPMMMLADAVAAASVVAAVVDGVTVKSLHFAVAVVIAAIIGVG